MIDRSMLDAQCGDRINIWRTTVERLHDVDDKVFVTALRGFFLWFETSEVPKLEDSFSTFIMSGLIEDQKRAVAKALEKKRQASEAGKRSAARHTASAIVCQRPLTPVDTRQRPSPPVNGYQHPVRSVNDRQQSESKSESGAKTETKVKSESSSYQMQSGKLAARPTLEEVRRWSEGINVSEKFAEDLFRRCESVGWTAKGEPIASWRSYFLACWKEFKGKKIAEAYDRLHDDGPDCGDSGNEAFTYDKKRMELYNARHSEAPIGLTTNRFDYYVVAWPSDGVALKEATEMMDKAVERGKFDWTYHSEARKIRYD